MPTLHLRPIRQPMSVEKRRCPRCQGRMTLTKIEPESPGVDRRIFDCRKCGLTEKVLVKFH